MCVSDCVCEVSHGGGAGLAERAPGSLIPDQRVSRASGAFPQAVTLWSGARGPSSAPSGWGEKGTAWSLYPFISVLYPNFTLKNKVLNIDFAIQLSSNIKHPSGKQMRDH